MTARFPVPEGQPLAAEAPLTAESAQRALKDFRYIVASVDEDALAVWAELWKELSGGVTPAGVVLPESERGYAPACGWPQFLEKFWLLKHYLDCIHHFCANQEPIAKPESASDRSVGTPFSNL